MTLRHSSNEHTYDSMLIQYKNKKCCGSGGYGPFFAPPPIYQYCCSKQRFRTCKVSPQDPALRLKRTPFPFHERFCPYLGLPSSADGFRGSLCQVCPDPPPGVSKGSWRTWERASRGSRRGTDSTFVPPTLVHFVEYVAPRGHTMSDLSLWRFRVNSFRGFVERRSILECTLFVMFHSCNVQPNAFSTQCRPVCCIFCIFNIFLAAQCP